VHGIGPAILSELNDCGIKNSSLTILLDMISPENSGKVIEIISRISKSHKANFSIKSGMTVYHNSEDNALFEIDEYFQSSKNIVTSEYRPINDVYDDDDFQQRKAMREALRD
jgi:hypothetical protein